MTSKRSPSFSELDPTQDDVHAEGSSGPGITVRRREANRLAAQRFRSRKKGYQDSLEERIKALEEERDGLLRRQGETPEGREEIRGVYEENDRLAGENERLHRELENWKRWRDQVSDA
jgi:predicted nuclease with TOPRIM domain